MPANLPPQYFEIEKKYRDAKDPQEKMAYLQELMAIIPKHKGTEKLQADLKTKMSKLKDTMEKTKKGGGAATSWYQVDRQGAGQIVLAGAPNAGKSALLNRLTHASVEVADYPFTTAAPQIGMMDYEDIKIQVVDTPPLADSAPPWLYAIYRTADILLIILDAASEDVIEQYDTIKTMLNERNIIFDRLESNNVKALLLLNKIDGKNARENAAIFVELCKGGIPIFQISTTTGENIDPLKKEIYRKLDIIRVYTKKIGSPPVKIDPIVLKTGTTVIQAAEYIHKDFKHNLQYTRLWNESGYNGQRVEKTHVLKNGDIIEFHV